MLRSIMGDLHDNINSNKVRAAEDLEWQSQEMHSQYIGIIF
jgi:hypothetical protein